MSGRTPRFGRPAGLLASHTRWQREPNAVASHSVTAIEVGQHESSRVRVGHDHLGNHVCEDGQKQQTGSPRATAGTGTGHVSSEMRSLSRPMAG